MATRRAPGIARRWSCPLGNGMSGSPAFSGAIHTERSPFHFPERTSSANPESRCGRQRRLFERESVKGAWNDDERAVGNLEPQGFVKGARGKKVELTVQDDRRNADRMKLRRQRFEFEKRLHQVLQRIDIVGEPALPLDRFEVAKLRSEPGVGQVHRQQQVLQIACPAKDQAGPERIAEQQKLRR